MNVVVSSGDGMIVWKGVREEEEKRCLVWANDLLGDKKERDSLREVKSSMICGLDKNLSPVISSFTLSMLISSSSSSSTSSFVSTPSSLPL